MYKFKVYIKSLWQSIMEKPIIFIVFILTILISVMSSNIFYRMAKREILYSLSPYDYAFTIKGNLDRKILYDSIRNSSAYLIYGDRVTIYENPFDKTSPTTSYNCSYLPEVGGFKQSELDSGKNIAIITSELAERDGFKLGDKIKIETSELEIIRINNMGGCNAFFPANLNIQLMEQHINDNGSVTMILAHPLISLHSHGRMPSEFEKIAESNVVHNMAGANSDTINLILLGGVALILLAAINILIAFKFVIDKNGKRYTLFKTLGAKNSNIAIMILLENFFAIVVAFALGIFVEHFIAIPVINTAFVSLTFVDYVYLFLINTGVALSATAYVIIKKSKMMPAKYLQRRQ